VFAGARLGGAATSISSSSATPVPAFGPVPGNQATTTSNTAATLVGGVNLSASANTGETAVLGYRAESGTVAGERQVDQSVSATLGGTRAAFSAVLGRRVVGSVAVNHATAGITIAATPVVAIQLAAGNYPANRMLGMAAGKFVNAGLTMRIGRASGSMPAPAGAPAPMTGSTRIASRAADAQRVELAGDFTKWKPVPATRASNGVWYADIALPPGEYRYAFRIDGKEWRVPEGVAAADDEFGGKTAWLTVRAPTPSSK
jgi:hypothetical protein